MIKSVLRMQLTVCECCVFIQSSKCGWIRAVEDFSDDWLVIAILGFVINEYGCSCENVVLLYCESPSPTWENINFFSYYVITIF